MTEYKDVMTESKNAYLGMYNEASNVISKVYTKYPIDSWVIIDYNTYKPLDVKKPSKKSPNYEKYLDIGKGLSSVGALRYDKYIADLIRIKMGQDMLSSKQYDKLLGITKKETTSMKDMMNNVKDLNYSYVEKS